MSSQVPHPRYTHWRKDAADAEPVLEAIRAAVRAGISRSELCRHAGVSFSTVDNHFVRRDRPNLHMATANAERLLDAIEFLVAQRRNRLNTVLSVVKRARPLTDTERLPTQPLIDLVTRSCGSVKSAVTTGRLSDADRRQLYRCDTVDLGLADRVCLEFGKMLEDVYGDMEGAA